MCELDVCKTVSVGWSLYILQQDTPGDCAQSVRVWLWASEWVTFSGDLKVINEPTSVLLSIATLFLSQPSGFEKRKRRVGNMNGQHLLNPLPPPNITHLAFVAQCSHHLHSRELFMNINENDTSSWCEKPTKKDTWQNVNENSHPFENWCLLEQQKKHTVPRLKGFCYVVILSTCWTWYTYNFILCMWIFFLLFHIHSQFLSIKAKNIRFKSLF